MSKMNISLSSLGPNWGAVSSGNSKWKHSGQQQIGAFAVSTSRRYSFGMSCGQLSLFFKVVRGGGETGGEEEEQNRKRKAYPLEPSSGAYTLHCW